MGNYDFDGLNDYEIEFAKGYIDMSELNLNIDNQYNYSSNEGTDLGIAWAKGELVS